MVAMTAHPARVLSVLLTTLILSGHIVAGAADNWPQFRGSRAGVARRRCRPARQLERDGERRLEDRRPRARAGARRSCGAITSSSRPPSTPRTEEPLKPVRPTRGARRRPDVRPRHRLVHRLVPLGRLRHRFQERQASAGRAPFTTGVPVEPKHQKNSYASETPATDGERVYVYSGNVGLFAFDMNGKPAWSKPMRAVQGALRLGPRLVARRPQGSRLHRQRQRRAVVHRGVRRAHRRGDLDA